MATRLRRVVPRLALDGKEAAEALGMSIDHFERHVKKHVPVVLSGAKRLYPVHGLQRWLDEESVEAGRRASDRRGASQAQRWT